MKSIQKDTVIRKINGMSKEQVLKVLIFMAGMEAGDKIRKTEKIR